jgi:hypothetical protein
MHLNSESIETHIHNTSKSNYELYYCNVEFNYFSFLGWGGVRLSPLGTSATNWPIVPAPDDHECGAVC